MVDRVFLTTTAVDSAARPWATANFRRLVRAAAAYRGRDLEAVDNPRRADFVLFVESSGPYLFDVLLSPLFRRHRARCYVFNSNDDAAPVLPGMYPDVSAPVRRPAVQLGGFYVRSFDNRLLAARPPEPSPRWLFSFVGDSRNAPGVRNRILGMRHPAGLLLDRSSGLRDDDPEYVRILRASRFVICPRGLGPTGWRFYEAMMAGRVPVIVSDGWLPAREIDWPAFSLRVPEADVESIPRLCERNADRAREMGEAAREEWQRSCSLESVFGWVGRRLRELGDAGESGAGWHDALEELAFRGRLPAAARWCAGRLARGCGAHRVRDAVRAWSGSGRMLVDERGRASGA